MRCDGGGDKLLLRATFKKEHANKLGTSFMKLLKLFHNL